MGSFFGWLDKNQLDVSKTPTMRSTMISVIGKDKCDDTVTSKGKQIGDFSICNCQMLADCGSSYSGY